MEQLARPIHLKTTVGAVLAAGKGRGGVSTGKALRQFLHAIHACPTASAAWLNASEVCMDNNTLASRLSEGKVFKK